MATAKQGTVTTFVEEVVKKPVIEETFTLVLTRTEAEAVKAAVGHVEGNPTECETRKACGDVYHALDQAGIRYGNGPVLTGTLKVSTRTYAF